MLERPDLDDSRSATTPMMAIPATRRVGDTNRHSAILEIDAPQLSRPSSSRSLKSLAGQRPQSSGHRRHHSSTTSSLGSRVPQKKGHHSGSLPARNWDENRNSPPSMTTISSTRSWPRTCRMESSGDEQMSIFATISGNDLPPSSLDPDRNLAPYLSSSRRYRFRHGEKSISGLSLTSRGHDDGMGPSPAPLSKQEHRDVGISATASASIHHLRSPRLKSAILQRTFCIRGDVVAHRPLSA